MNSLGFLRITTNSNKNIMNSFELKRIHKDEYKLQCIKNQYYEFLQLLRIP